MCYGQKPHILHWILESLFIILPLSLLPLQAQKIQAKQMMTLDLLSVKYELLGWYKDIFNPLMVPLNKINDHKDIGKDIGRLYYKHISSFRIIIHLRLSSVHRIDTMSYASKLSFLFNKENCIILLSISRDK